MAKHSVGIIGASGLVGKFLTPGFLEHGGYDVTLLTRKGGAGKLADFAAKGAKVVEVDFANHAELTAALQGLETVVSAVGTEAFGDQVEVVKAAQEAGVKRFLPSEFGVNTSAPGMREYFRSVLSAKYAVRDALEASGMEWTYVVTGFFLETTFSSFFFWDLAAGKATLKGKTHTPWTMTPLADVARWVPRLLHDPASRNATVYLEGEAVTFDQAVEAYNQAAAAAGKRPLEVTRRSPAELDADIAAAPSLVASFPDLLLRASGDGWVKVPEGREWNQEGPSVSLAQYFAGVVGK